MKHLFLIFTLFSTLPFFGQDTLKIMTFNTEFMWDGEEPEEGKIQFEHRGNVELAEEHMRLLAKVIKRNNPDIINLIETEGIDAVNKMNEKFLQGQGYKVYFAQGLDTYTGQDLAVLSRVEMYDFGRYGQLGFSGMTKKSVTKNYFGLFKFKETKIALIGLHFLSQPTAKDRISKRQAQATAMKNLAVGLDHLGYNIVMLGDYNDYDGAEDCLDINKHKPTSKVLWMLKKLDGANPDDDLINVTTRVKQEERYTAHYDKNDNGKYEFPKEVSAIDHILISKKLEDKIVDVKFDHTHDPTEVSDHFPVMVTLVF